MRPPRLAMVTYSTRPRGGVVHSLYLAEALHALGIPVHLFTLGEPGTSFYRPTSIPHTVVPHAPVTGNLETRVAAAVDALARGLADGLSGHFDLVHAQDCIAANALLKLRQQGVVLPIVRTVHHVDDFTTPALVECQLRSILDPDRILVVSDFWRRSLRREFGVEARVVPSGVDARRFRRPPNPDGAAVRARVGATAACLFLTVGGIEPRKGSLELFEALGLLRRELAPPPVLAVVGGHAFQDYGAYRDRALARAHQLGLRLGRDIVILGTVPDDELPRWYWAADVFVFPSVKEGFGLAVLEAMAAGLPVVASDISVFREYLRDGQGAVLAPTRDPRGLAAAMARLATDPELRAAVAAVGPGLASNFTWRRSAQHHLEIYEAVLAAA